MQTSGGLTEALLTVTWDEAGDRVTVLAAVGELDRDSGQLLAEAAEAALAAGARRLVLDLGAVTFCDSGGLKTFVHLHRRMAGQGGSLHLAALLPPVAAVLRTVALDRMLTVHATVRDAVG